MRRLPSTLSALCLLLLALPAGAQEKKAEEKGHAMGGHEMGDMAAMMEAYQKAGTPGEMHQKLASMAGTWTAEVKMWMDPSGPPMSMDATIESRMVMDGRFLHDHVKSDFMGQPFEGVGLTGYNNVTGQVQAIWIDNHGTGIYTYTGQLEGNQLTLTGTYKDPVSGEWVKTRSVRTIRSADEMLDEAYEIRNGTEVKTMEIVSRRQK